MNIVYDDFKVIPRHTSASLILFLKFASTVVFNVIGIYAPENVVEYPWVLINEAFHHYHSRIFYLLCLHRNLVQLYSVSVANGVVQRHVIYAECLFDCVLIGLYVHEKFVLHNLSVFMSFHVLIHFAISLLSLFSLYVTRNIKTMHLS